MIKHSYQSDMGNKGLFQLIASNYSASPRDTRNVEAEAEAREEGLLLMVLLLMTCSACFLTVLRSTSPGLAPTHSELTPPTSIKKMYHGLSHLPI